VRAPLPPLRAGKGVVRTMTKRLREDVWEGSELGAGASTLLYPDIQLYTPTRRAAQVVLLQEEIRVLQRQYNAKWQAAHAAKQKALDRIDERLSRIQEVRCAGDAVW
jgi:hypothetical protein